MKNINSIPQSIPEAQTKKKYYDEQKIPYLYLGQGLIFTPPISAEKDFHSFLRTQSLSPESFPLEPVYKKINTEHEVWYSPEFEKTTQQYKPKNQKNAFGTYQYDISKNTIHTLFNIPENNISAFQCDNLIMALESCFLHFYAMAQKKFDAIALPQKYKYSGYIDFYKKIKALQISNPSLEIIEIPEVDENGNQDIKEIQRIFSSHDTKNILWIDQEYNNNASGYDRNSSLNQEILETVRQNPHVIYFGDIAYKGLKESLFEPYPLVKKIHEAEIFSYFYCSFSKITNYRDTPSYKNILWASTQANQSQTAFSTIGRQMGIGCSSDGAEIVNRVLKNPIFQKEIQTLNLYLQYIKTTVYNEINDPEIKKCFAPHTSGIFRVLPISCIEKINSSTPSIITVGQRINIWPLGDPQKRQIFIQALQE